MVHLTLVTVMFHRFTPRPKRAAKSTPPLPEDEVTMSNTSRPAGEAAPQVPAGAPGRPRLPRDIKVMLVAAFLIALGFGLVAPVLPQFATTFDVGATAAAVIVSIFAFMRLIFAPAGGALIVKL